MSWVSLKLVFDPVRRVLNIDGETKAYVCHSTLAKIEYRSKGGETYRRMSQIDRRYTPMSNLMDFKEFNQPEWDYFKRKGDNLIARNELGGIVILRHVLKGGDYEKEKFIEEYQPDIYSKAKAAAYYKRMVEFTDRLKKDLSNSNKAIKEYRWLV